MTEHGYPSDPEYQQDPAYRAGEWSQAAYLARTLPDLRSGGAARIFVTLKDSDEFGAASPYPSEGIVRLAGPPDYGLLHARLAFETVASLNRGR